MSNNKNPWLALRTYQEEDANKFKGREKETEEMFSQIKYNDYFLCYAASGDGKSSIINAGLCPKMREAGMFPIKILFTTEELENEYNKSEIENLIWNKILSGIKKSLEGQAALWGINDFTFFKGNFVTPDHGINDDNSIPLWYKLRTYKLKIEEGNAVKNYIPVIIFDQFEEVFRAKWKSSFFDWLQEISSETCPQSALNNEAIDCDVVPINKPFKILFSMRYEYVGELDYWCSQRYFIPELMRNRYFLKPISIEQAKTIIESQEQQSIASRKITENADQIINNIANNDTNAEVSSFIFSLLCYSLYEKWDKNENYVFQPTNTSDLIINYYELILKKLNVQSSERNALEVALLSSTGNRRRMPMSEDHLDIFIDNSRQAIIQSLENEHILRIIREGKKTDNERWDNIYVEFIHDRLASAIFEKRNSIKESSRRNWFRILLGLLYILMLWITYHNIMETDNHNFRKQYPYAKLIDNKENISTKDSVNAKNNDTIELKDKDRLKEIIVNNNGGEVISIVRCPQLKKISIQDSITSIKLEISDCPNLSSVIIPQSVNNISLCIRRCPCLFNIYIPNEYAYLNSCNIISDVLNIDIKNSRYKWYNDALWDLTYGEILYKKSFLLSDSQIEAPHEIEKDTINVIRNNNYRKQEKVHFVNIGGFSFSNDVQILDLRELQIDTIPASTCSNMPNLRSLYLPRTIKVIESSAFENCRQLEMVNFEECKDLFKISYNAFKSCEKLKSVNLKNCTNKLIIDGSAFENCTSVSKIQFPKSMKSIGGRAFDFCHSLKSIIFPDTLEEVSTIFKFCRNLRSVVLPHKVNEFRESFQSCLNLNEIDLNGNTDFKYFDGDSTLLFKNIPCIYNKVKYHTFNSNDNTFISYKGSLLKKINKVYSLIDIPRKSNLRIKNVYGYGVIIDNREFEDSILLIDDEFNLLQENIRISSFYIPPSNFKLIDFKISNVNATIETIKLIPDSLRKDISVNVPYGCLQYYINNPDFSGIKEVTEDKYYMAWNYLFENTLTSSIHILCSSRVYIWELLFIGIIILFLAYTMYSYEQREANTVKYSKIFTISRICASIVLFFVFWYIIYWFVYLSLEASSFTNNLINGYFLQISSLVIAIVISTFSVSLMLYSNGFSRKEIKKHIRNFIHFLPYIYLQPRLYIRKGYNYVLKNKIVKYFIILVVVLGVTIWLGSYSYDIFKVKAQKMSQKIIIDSSHCIDSYDRIRILTEGLDNLDFWRNQDFYHEVLDSLYQSLQEESLLDTDICKSFNSMHFAFCNDNSYFYSIGDSIYKCTNGKINECFVHGGLIRDGALIFNDKMIITKNSDYDSDYDTLNVSLPSSNSIYQTPIDKYAFGVDCNNKVIVWANDNLLYTYNIENHQYNSISVSFMNRYEDFCIADSNDIYYTYLDSCEIGRFKYDSKLSVYKSKEKITTFDFTDVAQLSFTKNQKYLYAYYIDSSNNKKLIVWDSAGMKLVKDVVISDMCGAELSNDAKTVLVKAHNGGYYALDLEKNKKVIYLKNAQEAFLSPDGKNIVYSCKDKLIKHTVLDDNKILDIAHKYLRRK